MSNVKQSSILRVIALEISEEGQVSTKQMAIDRDGQLENTLLKADYPDIRVATVDIPQQALDQYQQAMVEHSLGKNIVHDGVEYSLVGASASAKNGKYYAVDAKHAKLIAQRFRYWPEAAMTYFGILVSPCKVCLEFPKARVIVVKDHELGTNDCRGWLRRSMFARLGLPDNRFYQFRLSFDNAQAKGSFKIMEDDVADVLAADIIIPRSSCKPEYRKPETARQAPTVANRVTGQHSEGRVVIGIREVSRPLEFSSSYTLIEHAPIESIEREIKPIALEAADRLKAAADSNDFAELFRVLGMSEDLEILRSDDGPADPDHTSTERTVVEAVLKADNTGYWVKNPFINSHLQRILAKWVYKLCTAGGFTLPAFALADDGYLILYEGRIYSGSDWIPENTAVTGLGCNRMLVVRYPIRTKADLLPVTRLDQFRLSELLADHLHRQKCAGDVGTIASEIVAHQLHLDGTFTLHADTAKRNGGDYDFDWICVVEGDRFPLFVEDRVRYQAGGENTKNKESKKESPWWNLAQVAYSAKGNAIGSITDLKTSCLAAGRTDLADRCAIELQKALDQLKWGVEPDQEEIARIRQEVGTAPWLKLKRIKRVADLPMHLETAATDRIGTLYNCVRKKINDFFADVRPLEDFRGAICAGNYDRDMYQEAGIISTMYAVNIGLLAEKRQAYERALEQAQKDLEAFSASRSPSKEVTKQRKELVRKRNQAQAALHFYEERSRREMRNLINIVRKWAERKENRAADWLTALWDIACKSRRWDQKENRRLNTGSIVFYAFPQQMVDMIVDRTGGRPITVSLPDLVSGQVNIDEDGNIFLVNEVPDGNGSVIVREDFLMQVSEARLTTDRGRSYPVRPFAMQAGRAEVRDGRLVLPDTQQRPGIPKRKSAD